MSPSELKYNYNQKVGGYYFTRSSMKFFGDTMKNYGCRKVVVPVMDYSVEELKQVTVYELYRKNPVKHGLRSSAYFDATTFEQVHPPKAMGY